MNRAAAARPSGTDAEPEPWERAAFPSAVHSDPIELAGAKRALKAFFFRLLPDIKVEDSFGEADQVMSTLMVTATDHFPRANSGSISSSAPSHLRFVLMVDCGPR